MASSPKTPRRHRGAGSIQRKRNGDGFTYYAVIYLDCAHKWLAAGPTRNDAEALLHAVKAGVVDPRTYGRRAAPAPLATPLPSQSPVLGNDDYTLADFADAWLEHI